jgi:MGT family glycosyltransferase
VLLSATLTLTPFYSKTTTTAKMSLSSPIFGEIINFPEGTKKPRILAAASPVAGHVAPVLRVVEELAGRGYDVSMLAGVDYHKAIKSYGARPLFCEEMLSEAKWAERALVKPGPEQLMFDMTNFFIAPTAYRQKITYEALEQMRDEDPDTDIVVLVETFWLGTHPMFLGAQLPKGFTKRPRVINIHALCYFVKSIDCGPVGMGLLPDPTPEGRERMAKLRAETMQGPWEAVLDMDEKNMRSLGAVNYRRDMLWELWQISHDLCLQMCHPALEFNRPDWHPKVHFVGSFPPKPIKADQAYPSWWNEVTSGDKRVIVISQGTIALNYDELLVPTFKALADRDDLLLVALLGIKGASLPEHIEVPKNARVLDYFPYDTLLPHASAFVFNAGYGGYIHGATNGVPMVLAGISEEKPEICARAEYAGIGVNLRTSTPTVTEVGDAVNKILTDPSFKKKASKIKSENEQMSAVDALESAVLKMGALGYA